jgi:hypothetical protein
MVKSLVALSLLSSTLAAPCDILDAAGNPCVAAHSTTRALYDTFDGPLYQVRRMPENKSLDIGVTVAGGVANTAPQDAFCGTESCVIWKIYDQSPRMNHLGIAPPGGAHRKEDAPTNATKEALKVNGHKVYSGERLTLPFLTHTHHPHTHTPAAYFEGGMGYRIDDTSGIAKGDEAETMYMVTSGKNYNNRCCFDYGNAETDDNDDGAGTMEAIYFGSAKGGLNHGGDGPGPWIMADMEVGMCG